RVAPRLGRGVGPAQAGGQVLARHAPVVEDVQVAEALPVLDVVAADRERGNLRQVFVWQRCWHGILLGETSLKVILEVDPYPATARSRPQPGGRVCARSRRELGWGLCPLTPRTAWEGLCPSTPRAAVRGVVPAHSASWMEGLAPSKTRAGVGGVVPIHGVSWRARGSCPFTRRAAVRGGVPVRGVSWRARGLCTLTTRAGVGEVCGGGP